MAQRSDCQLAGFMGDVAMTDEAKGTAIKVRASHDGGFLVQLCSAATWRVREWEWYPSVERARGVATGYFNARLACMVWDTTLPEAAGA